MTSKIAIRIYLALGALAVVIVLVYFVGIPAFVKGMIRENMLNEPRLVAGEGDYQGGGLVITF